MRKDELEQLVAELRKENKELYNRINNNEKTKNLLTDELTRSKKEIENLHYMIETKLTDIIYGLITQTNTEIEKEKLNQTKYRI